MSWTCLLLKTVSELTCLPQKRNTDSKTIKVGSAMVANSPGTLSDIVNDDYRALAFSIWSIGPFNGPTFGPIIGGFSTQYSKPLYT